MSEVLNYLKDLEQELLDTKSAIDEKNITRPYSRGYINGRLGLVNRIIKRIEKMEENKNE